MAAKWGDDGGGTEAYNCFTLNYLYSFYCRLHTDSGR